MTGVIEVEDPIICSPYEEPQRYWYIQKGETPEKREGRRPAIIFPPRDQKRAWTEEPGIIRRSTLYTTGFELELANDLRVRVKRWREEGYSGVSRTTLELLQYWRRDGRDPRKRLFFAQLEAAETIIFLKEARADLRQGLTVPRDEPSAEQKDKGYGGFERLACKVATGGGKTTVMAMLAAWSILNKANNRQDARFSDVVLIVCPNVTIRTRLDELNPEHGEASLYRTRDLVPPHLMPMLRQGKVIITNWHVFQPQTPQLGGVGGRVIRTGRPVRIPETINIGPKTTTARGWKYLTLDDYRKQRDAGLLEVQKEERDKEGNLKRVRVITIKYIESDTALVQRVLGREVGGKRNILVMNDEAHHAYRIVKESDEEEGEEEEFGETTVAEAFYKEATVWIDGLDRIDKLRGINFCVDLSATPFYLGRIGQETNKPFPWVVSDFGLIEAIESGLVKIPQLAIRDTSGEDIPGYFNIWRWIIEDKLTSAERGGRKGNPKPEAILKWAHTPIAMLGSLWEEMCTEQDESTRPPVFILVCKNTKIAKVVYEWLAEGNEPKGIPPCSLTWCRNRDDQINTIRVDSKVVQETDTGESKSDESWWMRLSLDTVGKREWPSDSQGRPLYPVGFEDLAKKLDKPLHPPGRDIRCIVSVGMLTEGWDCTTVSHIIGLRPFMSQLLCEQVVGRGLRRTSYDIDESTGLFQEEVAKVLGVPFEVIPFKANTQGAPPPKVKQNHIHALLPRAALEITFPRVEGYTQAIRNRIAVDWDTVAPLNLDPSNIPPEVEMKALNINNEGRLSLTGPGRIDLVKLDAFRSQHRIQALVFDVARDLTKSYKQQASCEVPTHVLFPQIVAIAKRYIDEMVVVVPPADRKDLFLSPYYGWLVEHLTSAIRSDTTAGETPEVPIYESSRGPGSTRDVDTWTSKPVREVCKSHVNYIVADTKRWEQSAAYYIDTHEKVAAFVKNHGLGFAIPYLHNGQPHDYIPDFIIRFTGEDERYLILEIKGHDQLKDVKRHAAGRWVAAVNADGSHGTWQYAIAFKPEDVTRIIDDAFSKVT